MVIKSSGLFLLLFFFLLSGAQGIELNKKEIAQEIKYAFEKDILISKKISANRKFYQSNYDSFEKGPVITFLSHTDPSMTLKTIIGNNYFNQIPTKDRNNLELEIKNTFRRYAYEWLDSNLNIELKLNSINILSENQAVLLVDRSQKIIPRIDLKLYVHKGSNGWKVYDFGIWNFRYTQMKRRKYLAFIRNDDLDGLKNFLEQKNNKFFD